MSRLSNNSVWQASKRLARKANIQSLPGEIMEEYYNNVLGLLNGDTKPEDFLKKDMHKQNITMAFMGALPFAGAVVTEAGGRARRMAMPYRYRHLVRRASDKGRAVLGDDWDGIRDTLDGTPSEGMESKVRELLGGMSAPQQKAVMDYATALTALRAHNVGRSLRDKALAGKGEEGETDRSDLSAAQQEAAYAQGRNLPDGMLGSVKPDYEAKRKDLSAKLGVSEDELEGMDDDALDGMMGRDDDLDVSIMNYMDAKYRMRGVIDQARDDMDAAAGEVSDMMDHAVNPEDGKLHAATLDDGRKVYVVNGTVTMMDDGKMADKEASDESIVVYDPDSGKTEMTSPEHITALDEPVDGESARSDAEQAAREQFAAARADQIDGLTPKQNPQLSDDVWVKNENGDAVHGVVTQVDPVTGEYMVQTDTAVNGKKAQPFQASQLYDMAGAGSLQTHEGTSLQAGEKGDELNVASQGQQEQPQEQQEQPQEQQEQPQGKQEQQEQQEQPQEQQEQSQEQQEQPQGQPQEQQGQQEQPQSALDRIPSDEVTDKTGNTRTVHHWEQAEPGDTYDALTEIYHDNADRVKKGVQNRINTIDKQIKATQKKMDAIDNSDDFDAVAAQGEQYDRLQQQKDALEQQKKYWQGVQSVPLNRRAEQDKRTEAEQAAAKAERAKAEAAAIEEARRERERVNGVPDVVNDTPSDARQRGFRNVNGMVVERQQKTDGVTGRESSVKFSSKDTAQGHIKVIDADELQPSHVSGQRNPQFFIDEAQPKDRTDAASSMAAAKIASSLNPEEITGDGSAYQFSAPTVNSRGEVIQGNNRSDALKLMYSTPAFQPAQDAYKQYIIDHASDFGFTPEDVEKIKQMKHPVMVNELDVSDDEAIRLGQMKASDNESGGIERIDPVTTSKKLGSKVGSFARILLSSGDEDASLSDVLAENGGKAVQWLRAQGVISDTAEQSAFDKKGNLTAEAKQDLQNILKQSLFEGGVSDLPTMFERMPAKAQKAILSTFMRDFDSAESERILPEIQKAIEAWYGCATSNDAFAKAGNYKSARAAMRDWTLQTNMLDDSMPSDKFSNFAMELACRLQGCTMREVQQNLNDFFDLVQGKSQGDLFGGTTMGEQADRQEAIRRVFDIDYKPIKNKENGKKGSNAVADDNSQGGEGRHGSPGDGAGRERAAGAEQHADVAGGAEEDDEGPKPVGHGRFGDIYTNYKGSFKDAVHLLKEKGSGYIRGMFHRDEIGDIDIAWGSAPTPYTGKGIAHILRKHVETLGDFKNENEAISVIEDTILHGDVKKQEGNTWAITKGDFQIVVTRDEDGNWVLTAFDRNHSAKSKKEKKDAAAIGTPSQPNVEAGAVASNLSAAKLGNSSESSDKKSEKVAEGADNSVKEAAAQQRPAERSNDSVHSIGATDTPGKVAAERQNVNTEPTEKQKEAGNYKKGHIKVDGFDITIENPKGSTRSGKDASGKAWSVPMHYDYGYIKGTEGVDGDHIDVYLSDEPTKGNVYVIDQVNQKDGSFDEHKVMYGFPSMKAAVDAYKGQYEDGWKVGTVTEVSREDFKKWVESSKRKTKPFAEYKSVETAAQQQRPTDSIEAGHKARPLQLTKLWCGRTNVRPYRMVRRVM